jgi:hypothetical protein
MRKPYETSADRVWKDKVEPSVTRQEIIILFVLAVALVVTLVVSA